MIVRSCLRDGRGGSPTAVLVGGPVPRVAVPGPSHTVWIGPGRRLRFFTAAGELPACGHGTVAALAVLGPGEHTLHAGGRTFAGRAWPQGGLVAAAFDAGPVSLRTPAAAEVAPVLAALGLAAAPTVVASVGRPRLLVPVTARDELAGLAPDQAALTAACDAAGLLGCYVYAPAGDGGRFAARMFAPSIGVPEDIANANSTACLAAALATDVTVDMGDALGEPATITAGPRGVGGVCR
ncbi:PhzF family phenazine biosynthesis protein [Dactylosporangium matsuzakiense]|uniref:PhzF family phenazine biosynthesis protein n=1 Tax=Dactylosporangium matsuzakiense TaxID=53360 RepID=UPI0021C2C7F8|nr:PhzF family phenazine biosynthesis protein [Dactylosporangium matsuzakiense]UWZ47248.1 PhzF family phenazine biosynthesis protein [Dactylosporangium matsuzakiense]